MRESPNLEQLLQGIFDQSSLISATLSSPLKAGESSKAAIRPIRVKGQLNYQITEQRGQQALHSNLRPEACFAWLKQHIPLFKQTYLYTSSADYHVLTSKKGQLTILKKGPAKAPKELLHNRKKEYVLEEGVPVPFLIHLGVMNGDGKVYPAKKDKFRQINRFLEMIEDVLPHLDSSCTLQIVDFGCGKAYLTFALYHFLTKVKGFQVQMVGLDLKRDVIDTCQELAQTLGYEHDLQFIQGDINAFDAKSGVDLVVSLHACDTATDAALEKAIRWQAKVILCVPCCQHELMHQVEQESLNPLLKHGILKERFAALATDAARVQLLDVLGYHTQIMEFIDLEHTPKNLLIRAVKRPHVTESQKAAAWQAYLQFKQLLSINPSLECRFQSQLS